MPLFGKSSKSAIDLVKSLHDALLVIEKGDSKKLEKASEDVSKSLVSIKNLLYGTNDQQREQSQHHSHSHHPNESQTDIAVAQLAQEIYNSNLLSILINNLSRIEFEAKKDVAQIFNNILRRQIGTRSPTVEYICTKPDMIFTLIGGYEKHEIALNCGSMLRECARYDALAKIVLYSQDFYHFFRYVEVSTFDIASDAFSTFKELLTRHKQLSAEFLDQEYEQFFTSYQRLLNSDNYVTKRQSLKLLGELLLDRHNFTIMTRYISCPDNLKLMMNLLKDKSRNIQFEAFHVFKVFVANPNKPRPIADILLRNKDKLVDFLSKFQTDRFEDEQFNDEKTYLINRIRDLKSASETTAANAAAAAAAAAATASLGSAGNITNNPTDAGANSKSSGPTSTEATTTTSS